MLIIFKKQIIPMKLIVLFLCIVMFSCSQKSTGPVNKTTSDPHSYARPDQAVVKHLDLDLKVDFDKQLLTGKAIWTIENLSAADTLIFDTHKLTVSRVILDDSDKPADFSMGPEDRILGSALKVNITKDTKKVTIFYSTQPDAAAIQWLTPQQTAGKKFPFLYTQSQAILARSWIPCQDSPGIRFTYSATVEVPGDLMALMSAKNPTGRSETGSYYFKQERAIPSYLMALAVGDLEFKAIDKRTGVYAEPGTLQKAVWEFADMGKMVSSAEKLYGPYQWDRYDVIVLPPSFPFGGMENPMLTFVTPTVIAGDRSLVSLIAHELAHSWSGNLATNATWNDFWLNEGFTVYFERRIVEDVYGKEEAVMQDVLGFSSLKETLQDLGETNPETSLKGNYAGRDPDEGMTDIAYEKGYLFLRTIEDVVGRTRMDEFLRNYFRSHAFQSVTTEQFISYLDKNLLQIEPEWKEKIDVEKWVFQPGLPTNYPAINSARFNAIDSLITSWNDTVQPLGWREKLRSANEQWYFIKALPRELSSAEMSAIDKEFNFTYSKNTELNCSWFILAIHNNYSKAYPQIEEFLSNVGRRKYLIPLYNEMVSTEKGREWAKQVYKKARPNYHSVSQNTIDDLLK